LGHDVSYDGIEIVKTMLPTGEAVKHPPRDIQFSVARFASPELARRAGEGTFADENNPVEAQSRIALGKLLRSLSGRIEQASRIVQHGADRLYEHARHPDGTTWSKVTLAEGVALVAGDKSPTLELTYAVHQHFMDSPLKYIADTFEHRLSNTFAVRPLRDVQRMERITNWVRNNDPVIDNFAAKARAIIEASNTQKRESMHEDPTWVNSREGLPELNEADRDILDFIRYFLRQRRELQENPCMLILPLILSKISPSYLPLVGHSAFRVLEDLSVLAPWSNHVMQDVDLQLHEFTDTLDTPLPSADNATPVVPVVVNDDRILGGNVVDGLDNMRHDFGDMAVYVIDDSTAEELDDGISVERTTDGSDNLWLHVHIADPTSVLRPNDPVALDASRRSATAYFPDCTYPMLPPTDLSLDALAGNNNSASMNVLSFSVLVNPAGDILKHDIRPGLVRRVHIMQYDDVTRALGESIVDPLRPFGGFATPSAAPKPVPPQTLPDLQLLQQVANRLAKARVAKTDSVLWSQPRAQISMNKVNLLTDRDTRPLPRIYRGFPQVDYSVSLGTMVDVRNSVDISRALVAECMITAGRVTSLFAQERGIPMVYRSLARPVGVGADKYLPLLPGRDPYQGTVLYRDALVQQLAQVSAQPMLTPATHWQLGISAEEGYVRATSPLRRYLDMLCHWQIKSALHPNSMGVKPPFSMDDLKVMMMKQHLQEQARRRAGTTSIRLWAMRYIQNQIAMGGHDVLHSLEGIVINIPLNIAHSLEHVIPVMIPTLGLPASVYGCDAENPPAIGSTLNVEITSIELGYNPRLVVRQRRS
jgi:exoribonuclease-2